MKKNILKVSVFSALFIFLSIVASFAFVYIQVSREASGRIERGIIDRIIFSESPVYYDDGESVIGVFFERTHRKYIHYNEIPPTFIKALVATEDKNFFSHPGFDVKAIIRAMLANIKAGRVTQGGSTITQQTAKNVFKREKRSLKAKIKELMQAILLEKEYSKEEILEMYINQFFVTGFGRGLRIAAQYFFDKEAEDLGLVESAFIAGSVKSPNRYNPFTKKTETEKKEAMRLAKRRKDYVLSNMLKMNFITKDQYLVANGREVPFKEGKVTYRLNVILDYIREQLESDYFRAVLQEQGIDNIATSGIKIYTSINKEIQEGALRNLRRHLPLLDVKLSGYAGDTLQERYKELTDQFLKKQEADLPFLGRITHLQRDPNDPYLIVAWNDGGGIIDYEGLRPLGDAWLKGRLGQWAVFDKRHIPDFLKHFHVGDLVPVQFLGDKKNNGQIRLVLSKIPELEGGIIVLQGGMIKAMVGGFFDRFFNRAVDAKRQLGSIFKPIVYAAALQLKWNSLDSLINRPDLFRFENTFYVPKPDHPPKSHNVSMAWAGCKSENLATVWLLYHLTDRLNMSEFRQVVELLGLARKEDESYRDYVKRIRDEHGVIVDREALMEAAFEEAKKEIESDLIFSGYEGALDHLRRLHYNLDTRKLDLQNDDEFQIHRLSFTRLQSLNFEMKKKMKIIKDLLNLSEKGIDPALKEILSTELAYFYFAGDGNSPLRVVYTENPNQLRSSLLYPMTAEGAWDGLRNIAVEEIWIDGLMPSKSIDLLQSQIRKAHERLLDFKRYDAEVLYKVSDFRRLVNLLYIIRLSEKMGISTRLDPVLSFPLGANSISILEAALAYHTLVTGKIYPLGDEKKSSMVPIITKMVDRESNTIWEYSTQPKNILSKRVSGQVSEILRLVVENGTGRGAKDAVHLIMDFENEKIEIPIPSLGKTGTANRFTNSSFVGIIPGATGESSELGLERGYVIASYIGYDDNRPMKGKQIAIYGASGALPLWIDTVNTIVNSPAYKKGVQVADLAFNAQSFQMVATKGLHPVSVSPTTGLPPEYHKPNPPPNLFQVLADGSVEGETLVLKRAFEPLRGVYDEKK